MGLKQLVYMSSINKSRNYINVCPKAKHVILYTLNIFTTQINLQIDEPK